jgi:hypothetical protein
VAEVVEPRQQPVLAGFLVTWLIVDELHVATLLLPLNFAAARSAASCGSLPQTSAEEGAVISFLEVRAATWQHKTFTIVWVMKTTVFARDITRYNEDAI